MWFKRPMYLKSRVPSWIIQSGPWFNSLAVLATTQLVLFPGRCNNAIPGIKVSYSRHVYSWNRVITPFRNWWLVLKILSIEWFVSLTWPKRPQRGVANYSYIKVQNDNPNHFWFKPCHESLSHHDICKRGGFWDHQQCQSSSWSSSLFACLTYVCRLNTHIPQCGQKHICLSDANTHWKGHCLH